MKCNFNNGHVGYCVNSKCMECLDATTCPDGNACITNLCKSCDGAPEHEDCNRKSSQGSIADSCKNNPNCYGYCGSGKCNECTQADDCKRIKDDDGKRACKDYKCEGKQSETTFSLTNNSSTITVGWGEYAIVLEDATHFISRTGIHRRKCMLRTAY